MLWDSLIQQEHVDQLEGACAYHFATTWLQFQATYLSKKWGSLTPIFTLSSALKKSYIEIS